MSVVLKGVEESKEWELFIRIHFLERYKDLECEVCNRWFCH